MGVVAQALPVILQLLQMVPTVANAGRHVIDGAKAIWAGVTSEEAPTPEQQQQYASAEQTAFDALMKSTEDVAEKE